MKILSIDAGAISLGISLWIEGKGIRKWGTVRLVPPEFNFNQFKRKYGPSYQGLLVRNFHQFAKNSKKWSQEFKSCDILIYEDQKFKFTHALIHGINSWVYDNNPNVQIHYVHPFSISRKFKIGGLTRTQRKKEITRLVNERGVKTENWSQDSIDSVLNIFYFLETREKNKNKKFLQPCPYWSSDSHSLESP
jgi:hypothetical protein